MINEIATYLLGPILCYLVGSIPMAYLLVKLVKGVDIRTIGSGNVGATNAARAFDPKHRMRVFAVVFAFDILKGLASVALIFSLVHKLSNPESIAAMRVCYGLFAIVGHIWPVYLSFKGGKGVATSTGVLIVVAPNAILIATAVWLVTVLLTKYVSLGSILGATSLSMGHIGERMANNVNPFGKVLATTCFCLLITLLVVMRHRANIKRLVKGTEARIIDDKG